MRQDFSGKTAIMTNQIYNITDDRFVPSIYSSGMRSDMRVHPYTSSDQLEPRVLELSHLLQTTLDVEKLIGLFAGGIKHDVVFDGLRYQLVSHGIDITIGDQPPHTCSYQLIVAEYKLGEIRFFRNRRFSKQEIQSLENLLCALIYPLRNALMYQDAVQSSFIDPLTGVKNRAAMDNALRREVELSHRQGASMSVILLDIDHFKQINDQYGHAKGDTVLRAVAQCAEQSIRSSDILFRFGGEEFLILLSYTRTDGALLLAERIRRNIEKLDPMPNTPLRVSVSLGVSSLKENEQSDSLFDRADKALYRAKQEGRNRVATG